MVQQTFGERMGAVYTSACISYLAQQFGFAYVGLNTVDTQTILTDMNKRLMNHENTSLDTGFKAWKELPHPFVTRCAGTTSTPMSTTFNVADRVEQQDRVQRWLLLCDYFHVNSAAGSDKHTNEIVQCVTKASRFAHQFVRAVLGDAYNNLLPV